MDERIFQHELVQEVHDRHDVRAAELDHPAGHRCASELHPEAIKLRFLAIQWYPVDELRRGDMRKERRRGETLRQDCSGTGAIATPVRQHGQAYFGRMCRITRA